MPTISDNIIDALGGTTEVSRKTEAALSTVHSWRKGLPPSRLAHLKLIAKDEGVEINWVTGERVEHAERATPDNCDAVDRNNGHPSTPAPRVLA